MNQTHAEADEKGEPHDDEGAVGRLDGVVEVHAEEPRHERDEDRKSVV